MENKRKLKRRFPIYYMKVYDRRSKQMVGRLVDITAEGMRLVSETPIEPGTVFNMRMDLPRPVENHSFLDFKAVSVWCDIDKNPDFFDTGYRILEGSPGSKEIIEGSFQGYLFQY